MPSISQGAAAGRRPQAHRPIALDNLRTFDAVARLLSFSAAGEALHLTQSAVSRRIRALEDEVGVPLFARDTRKVELTAAGEALRAAVQPALERVDRAVQGLRTATDRRHVSVTTFASFATLWLLPRMQAFQSRHPDIDIRIHASDNLIALDDPDFDVALRATLPRNVPAGSERMFDEWQAPVASAAYLARCRAGELPPLRKVADLAAHALIQQVGSRPGDSESRWGPWLEARGAPDLQPRRWMSFNYTHQMIQAVLIGQGVGLARLPMIEDALTRGELVEPFGAKGRMKDPMSYWIVPLPGARLRPELRAFLDWARAEARTTAAGLGAA